MSGITTARVTALVIFCATAAAAQTPYLVKPSNVALSAPTDGFIPPHDAQRLANSDTYRQTLPGPPKGPVPAGGIGLIGPVGFKLD